MSAVNVRPYPTTRARAAAAAKASGLPMPKSKEHASVAERSDASLTGIPAKQLGVTAAAAGPTVAHSKRALGDITNRVAQQQSLTAGTHGLGAASHTSKIRRGASVSTKPSSAAAKRRALAERARRQHHLHEQLDVRTKKQATELSVLQPSAQPHASVDVSSARLLTDHSDARIVAPEDSAPPAPLDVASLCGSAQTDTCEPEVRLRDRICVLPPLPSGVIDIDAGDDTNPLCASQFAREIFDNFRAREMLFQVDDNYMDIQDDITVKMRAILIDWLVDVHLKFKLSPETLHLTVSIIDRFLMVTPVKRRKLQLVGVTAMLIASKYEEIYAPETSDFVYISDKAYDCNEILQMEAVILNVLKFDVTVPSALAFLNRCLKAARAPYTLTSTSNTDTSTTMHAETTSIVSASTSVTPICEDVDLFALYVLELGLQSAKLLAFRPSVRAAAACMLALKCFGNHAWTSTLRFHSGGLNPEDLIECEVAFRDLLITEQVGHHTNKLTAVKRKFGSSKFNDISLQAMKLDLGMVPLGPGGGSGACASDYASMDICVDHEAL